MPRHFLYPAGTLPPHEARLIDPTKDRSLLIPTPVDERGLIDLPKLITDIEATIDPAFEWPLEASVHHLYHPGIWYPSKTGPANENPSTFRELPIHKALMPRLFENWLHAATEPAPVPDPEVMKYRIDAWSVAKDLFKMARKTVHWERLAKRRSEFIARNPQIINKGFDGTDVIGEEVMDTMMRRNFRGYERQMKLQDKIPPEYRLIELDDTPHNVAANLGKIVNRSAVKLTRRIAG